MSDFVKWLLQTAGEMFSDNSIMERNEGTPVNYLERGERYYRENKELLEEGIRLDAIGFQFHFMYGEACMDRHITGDASLHNIYSTYHKMATLNIPMYISEVTIPTVFEGMSQREGEEFQAEILEKLYRLWFSIPNMQGVIYWNFMDGKAWKSEGDADPGLIDGIPALLLRTMIMVFLHFQDFMATMILQLLRKMLLRKSNVFHLTRKLIL